MLNRQPTLIGQLVHLQPLVENDFDELFKAASDPLIWELHPQPNRHQPEVFRSFFNEALGSQGALAIRDLQSKTIIGTSRFYDYSSENSSVVVGYTFLARPFWGGRYNFDLKKLMVNFALNDVKTVYFHVGLGNFRSQHAMKKIGGVNTGVQEIAISYGPPKKSYVYKIESPLSKIFKEDTEI